MYLPVPLARASPGREEPVVGTYGALGAVVLGATLGVGVVVLVGMILPPGLVQGGSVRFVSDAFKEHRALPWIALPFNALNALCFWSFAHGADRRRGCNVIGHWMVGTAGLLSVLGFLMLALFHDGAGHYIGAVLFFNMHILMHYALYGVLWAIDPKEPRSRMLGRGALLLAAGFSICFTALLIAGLNGGPTMNGAAVTEYVLAIQLALLNLHAVSLMAYTGRGQAGARFDFLGGLPALWHEEAVRGQA